MEKLKKVFFSSSKKNTPAKEPKKSIKKSFSFFEPKKVEKPQNDPREANERKKQIFSTFLKGKLEKKDDEMEIPPISSKKQQESIYSESLIRNICVAFGVESLPSDVMQVLSKSMLDESQIKTNWFEFLNCLYYASPKKLLKRPTLPEIEAPDFTQCLNPLSSSESLDDFELSEAEVCRILHDSSSSSLIGETTLSKASSTLLSDFDPFILQLPPYSDQIGLGKRARRKHYSKSEISQLITMSNPHHLFSNLKEIGKGAYGKVYVGQERSTKLTRAIKKMNRSLQSDCDTILSEIEILKTSKCSNIVSYIATYHWEDQIWLVMEYADAGTLKQILTFQMKESHMIFVLEQILKGVKYLHTHNRIHRDLKSSNILLHLDGRVQLADFGLCVDRSEHGLTGMAGSKYWMAPEMITRIPYNEKVDIWSVGAIGIELITGKPPYHQWKPIKALFLTATRGAPSLPQTERLSPRFCNLIRKCFIMNHHYRPSASKLLKLKVFVGITPTHKQEFASLVQTSFLMNASQF